MVRTHVLLPRELVEELDRQVGPRKRSETIAALVEEFLRRKELVSAIDRFAGSLNVDDHPEWASREDIARWVHDERRRSDRSLEDISVGDLSS
jgi:metal-responsive CopG/Arc/MetJ family transcriptional regulator